MLSILLFHLLIVSYHHISLAVRRGSLLRLLQIQTLSFVLRDQLVRTNCLGREDAQALEEVKSSKKARPPKPGRASERASERDAYKVNIVLQKYHHRYRVYSSRQYEHHISRHEGELGASKIIVWCFSPRCPPRVPLSPPPLRSACGSAELRRSPS